MRYMAIIVVKSVQQDATIAFLFSTMALLYMFRVKISPIIMSTKLYMAIIVVKSVQEDAQLRFYSPQWLYMFRVTISPIIRSTMLYMAIIVVK